MRTLALLILLAAFLGAACSGDSRLAPVAVMESPTPVPTETTPSTGPRVPAGAPAIEVVPSTVWVIEAATGRRTTLFESTTRQTGAVWVTGADTVSLFHFPAGPGSDSREVEFRLDGSEIYSGPVRPPVVGPCAQTSSGASVGGRVYGGAFCGPISPDGRWMTYKVDAGMVEVRPGYRVPSWDQWVVELATGVARQLQPGLVHCGGCDGRFGESWSASGRFLLFPEFVQDGRVFVSDLVGGGTRQLLTGPSDISNEPDWSPAADLLVYQRNGVVVLEDMAAGTPTELQGLSWPVRFDPSGRYLYSPAWGDAKAAPAVTTVYDVRSSRSVATLAGRPRYQNLWLREEPVRAVGQSFIAVLEDVPDCGLGIYDGARRLACIAGGSGAVLSPDGRLAAIGRATGPGNPGIRQEYDVLLVETATGVARVVATGAKSEHGPPHLPPQFIWNESGTHLIVRWPFSGGGL